MMLSSFFDAQSDSIVAQLLQRAKLPRCAPFRFQTPRGSVFGIEGGDIAHCDQLKVFMRYVQDPFELLVINSKAL